MLQPKKPIKSTKIQATARVTFPERVWEPGPGGTWASRPATVQDLQRRDELRQMLSREPNYDRAYAAPVRLRAPRHKAAA